VRGVSGVRLVALAALGACAPQAPPAPAPASAPPPALRFQVLGNASPSDTGPPTLTVRGQTVTIQGLAVQQEGAGLYGDLDLSEPGTLRLTLYDSLSGRPVDDPLPPSQLRQVIYEAEVGPLVPGGYDVWVGRFVARDRLVEIAHEPLHIDIAADFDGELAALGAGAPGPELLADGGRLVVRGRADAPDRAGAIRDILARVAEAYARADFRWPRLGGGSVTAGTSLMAARGARIRYSVEFVGRGGAIRIRAGDPEAVRAVHAFLRALGVPSSGAR